MPSSDEEDAPLNIFQEPDHYYPPKPSAHYISHTLLSGQILRLRLVGSNPLWGHHLWNGAKVLSNHLETQPSTLLHDKTVLELGAGAGLPSLVASLHGAAQVVVTDYPDAELVENLQQNVDSCAPSLASRGGGGGGGGKNIAVEGYLWGAEIQPLLQHLPGGEGGFDTLLLADVLFNHHCHEALVETVVRALKRERGARTLVVFTPYRPWLLEKDLGFFELCRGRGLVVGKILEEVLEEVMFREDRGDELLRRTVFGYEVSWPDHLLK